ncbi:MAG: 2OG-Fe(II) oxygenase [Acidobacteriota bacterium]|nr:2OG-Fe(II) oxygenase [Acidobacteriota bacterium]
MMPTSLDKQLNQLGYAPVPRVLTEDQCARLRAMYDDDRLFRSTVDMTRYRFGEGEYKYFADPLPGEVQALRVNMYALLVPVANDWMERLGRPHRYPATLDEFRDRCRAHGQTRPTPLLLRYEAGGYNCLHQDLYGDLAFPFQLVVALSRRDVDYTGGEFLLVEQRPRAQSRGEAVTIEQGDGVIFANSDRPVAGARGFHRVTMRHGVSRVRSGERMTLGVIFHDAT